MQKRLWTRSFAENLMISLKLGTHDGTSPCNKSQRLVASCELAIFATKSSRKFGPYD